MDWDKEEGEGEREARRQIREERRGEKVLGREGERVLMEVTCVSLHHFPPSSSITNFFPTTLRPLPANLGQKQDRIGRWVGGRVGGGAYPSLQTTTTTITIEVINPKRKKAFYFCEDEMKKGRKEVKYIGKESVVFC